MLFHRYQLWDTMGTLLLAVNCQNSRENQLHCSIFTGIYGETVFHYKSFA